MSRFILFALLILMHGSALAARTVLVVGDSLSAGYGLRQNQAWPALLAERLANAKSDYQVINASISGDTSANGRSRLPAALKQHRPAIVVIALGANDGLRGLPVHAMRANLGAMAEASRAAGARVLILGMEMPPNYGPDYQQKFRESFAGVARDHAASLVPFMLAGFAEKREYFQADGIHPTAAAQPMIVDNVWPMLKPLLTRPATTAGLPSLRR